MSRREAPAPTRPARAARQGEGLLLLRARLDLPMTRRVVGLLEGRHRSLLHGHGQDFDDLSRYAPGDDLGDIDWRSSARAGIPLIKRYMHETTITVVLAVDTGRAMTATARGGQPKRDVVLDLSRLVGLLALDGADRLAFVGGDATRLVTRPARYGRAHTEEVLGEIARALTPDAPPSDVPRLLDEVGRRHHRRGLVVLVTDDAHPDADHDGPADGPDAVALRRLRTRHDVLVCSVADADPRSGVDVEDHWSAPELLARARGLDDALARAVAARAERRTRTLRRLGVLGLFVGHGDEVLTAFARMLGAGRARR